MFEKKSIGLTALCASLALLASTLGTTASAQERELRIVSWGGSFQAAQRKVYFEPFTKETGIKIKEDEWAKSNMAVVEAMVKSGKITWDIIDQGGMDIIAACDAGIVEPLDIEALGGKDRFLPGAVYECGIHTTIAAEIPAYNSDKFPGEKPDSLADFYDVAKFPGKRGMRKVAWANLEVALIADGVSPADMYDVMATDEGLERAFKKLDTIKPHVIWYTGNAEGIQMLVDGEVAMLHMSNARVTDAAITHKKPLKIIWDGAIHSGDVLAIVKGSPNKDLAMEFLKFANRHDVQMEWPKVYKYGPVLKSVVAATPEELGRDMPSHKDNLKNYLVADSYFYGDHGADLEKRFNAWLAK